MFWVCRRPGGQRQTVVGMRGYHPDEISFEEPKEIAQFIVIYRNFMPFNVILNVFSGRKKSPIGKSGGNLRNQLNATGPREKSPLRETGFVSLT